MADNTAFGLGSAVGQLAQNMMNKYYNSNGSIDNFINRTFDNSGYNQTLQMYNDALARDYNAEQAQLQRDFEDRMSSTAYQRAVKDMQAAGLNPYAVYGGASPSSTPSGSSAHSGSSGSSSAYGNELKIIGGSLKSAIGLVTSAFGLGQASTAITNYNTKNQRFGNYFDYAKHWY